MAHPYEAFGDDVEQEAANEFLGVERHQFTPILVFSIAVSEGDFTVVDRADAIIGKRHAVGVATEVIEDMGGRARRFFGIDHPRFFSQSLQEPIKTSSIGPGCDLSDEEQVVLMEALLERVEKFSTEDQTQSFNRKEKILTGRNPTLSIKRQNTRGNQTVQMKMIQQGLIQVCTTAVIPKVPPRRLLANLAKVYETD